MKVITVINDPHDFGFNLLRLSCALNNLQLVVLVSGGDFSTNRIKDELLQDYLEEVNNDEIIIFSDGNDAVFMASEAEILTKFNQTNSSLVFSAETECWPDVTLGDKCPQVSGPYKYLNSGGFIGRAGLIKELLIDDKVDMENFKHSNQYIWMQRYLNNTNKITLDTACEIFVTFTPQIAPLYSSDNSKEYFASMGEWFHNNFVIKNGRIFNTISKTWACHAHFNGFSKGLMNKHVANMIYEKIPSGKNVQFFYEVEP